MPKLGWKKNCFGNCDNGIAENVKKKKKKKKIILAIVAMPLPKMEKKNYEICEWVKKKKLSRPQYFYNIFTINHTWLIIISSKNLWQINCGNGITENVKYIYIYIYILAIVAIPLPIMQKKKKYIYIYILAIVAIQLPIM